MFGRLVLGLGTTNELIMWPMFGYINNNAVNCVNGISQNSNALQGNGGLPKLSLEETACILVVPDTLLNSAISSNSATPPTATQSIGGNQLSIVQRPNCLESLKTMPMLSVPAQIAKFSLILVNRILQTNNMDGDNDAQKKCDKYRVIGQCQVDNQPLYVNPKQYHRIMKRREARKKLTEGGRILIKRRVGISTRISA
uniref:Nuclear transcription factor Y subunit n=1 Tax=Rhodnius prolixus TaxID=13249 RepID=T1HNR3_RHOPR